MIDKQLTLWEVDTPAPDSEGTPVPDDDQPKPDEDDES